MKDIEKMLIEEIKNSGLSMYELAKRSGVSQASISLFMNGIRSLTLPSAAKIAKELDLILVKKAR